MIDSSLFAQAGGPTEFLFWLLRFAAGLGGAFLGWFVSDPLSRLLYRTASRKPIPVWLLPWCKLAGAAVVGLLVFFFIPLGGGPGGFGFGPGAGGGPGLGPGKGGEVVDPGKSDGKSTGDGKKKGEPDAKKELVKRKAFEVELLGGKRYQNDGKFYLLDRKAPAVALDEVEEYLKKHQDELGELRIVLTPESVDRGHVAAVRLHRLARDYQLTPITVEP